MKRILTGALAALIALSAHAATLMPIQLLSPVGSTSGQAIVSTGATGTPVWATVTATALVPQAANTVVANATGSTATPIAVSVPNCLGTSSALNYTAGSGFGCNATVNAVTLGGATFSAPGPIGSVSPGSGAFSSVSTPSATIGGGAIDNTPIGGASASTGKFTTLAASSTVSGTGFSTYLASPPAIGATAPNTGNFTRLGASGNDALLYTNTSGQSIPNSTPTTVTVWTVTSDRLNTNFVASTGVFTAPVTGLYLVSAQLTFATTVNAIGSTFQASIVANAVTVATGFAVQQSTGTIATIVVVPATVVSMTAGQTLVLQANQTSGGAKALSTSAALSFLSIYRLP